MRTNPSIDAAPIVGLVVLSEGMVLLCKLYQKPMHPWRAFKLASNHFVYSSSEAWFFMSK